MLTYLEQIVGQRTVDDTWRIHCARMAEFGFDRMLYAFTHFHKRHKFGHLDDMLILSNHEPDYLDSYIGKRMFEAAPMVKWAAENEGACSWNWVAEQKKLGRLSADELAATEYNLQHNVRAGYSISFPDTTTHKGGIGLCAREGLHQSDVEDIWKENGREIMAMNAVFHLQVSSMPHHQMRLSPRQRAVLEAVAEGKTMAQIAEMMELNIATVEKHLRRAREVLDVETTAQALMKASLQKQIYLRPLPKAKRA